ncbi:MAG: acetyltransferase [Planctomycetes bacterium]|nr:acetyltransferase [Planctomycetota bacterium]MCB9918433.1 acetyltransferase [Planctomycetota bacterium]
MAKIDVFNGDADGICALLQLRKAEATPGDEPRVLVTGVKRDIALLARVEAGAGDIVTVLDVSYDKNRDGVNRLLDGGATVRYFDHHRATDVASHAGFEVHIDPAPDICTSLIVDRYLNGRQRSWAVVGAFGDNLEKSAMRAAEPQGRSRADLESMAELGRYLNYNAYGRTVEDLYFAPAKLFEALLPYDDPLDFVRSDAAFATLRDGYREDITKAQTLVPTVNEDACAVFVLPDEPWAARVSGVFANMLASASKERAHALMTLRDDGAYVVSVRAPIAHPDGADTLCSRFPTGGGRKSAAGINELPASMADEFVEAFRDAYRGSR